MTIVRVQKHERNFTIIENATIRDCTLSFKARGLHHLLLSYPPNWVVNLKQLESESHKDGRDAIRTAFNELIDRGYATRSRKRNQDGTLGDAEYDVFEVPQVVDSEPESESPEDKGFEPYDGKPVIGEATYDGKSNVGLSNVGKPAPIKRLLLRKDCLEERKKEPESFSFLEENQKGGEQPSPAAAEPQEPSSVAGQSPPVEPQRSLQAQPNPGGKSSDPRYNPSLRMEQAYQAGGTHLHPDLVAQKLDGLHKGTQRYSDWTIYALQAARAQLQSSDPGGDLSDGRVKRYISNLLRAARLSEPKDYAALEVLHDSATLLEYRDRVAEEPVTSQHEQSPFERTESDIQAAREGLESIRELLPAGLRRRRSCTSS